MAAMKSETRTKQILSVMHVLTWIAFIGLMIKTGALLVAYGVSYVNPEAARNLYLGLDLYKLREASFWQYTQVVSFWVAFSGLKAYVLFLVISALSEINLVNPFTLKVTRILEKISHVLIGLWLVAVLYNAQSGWMEKRSGIVQEEWAVEGFFFMAGLVFIIAQIFKRGVEIQTENELTV